MKTKESYLNDLDHLMSSFLSFIEHYNVHSEEDNQKVKWYRFKFRRLNTKLKQFK